MTQPPEAQAQRPPPTRSTLSIFNDVYRANLLLMIVVILTGFTVSYMSDGAINPWSVTKIVTALYALVPFAAHRYVLSGEREAGFKSLAAAPPIITLLYAILATVFCIGTLLIGVHLIESLFFGNASSSATTIAMIFVGAALFVILCCSTLGMIFPALADGFNFKSIAAIRMQSLWSVLWRLTVLTVLFALLTFLMLLLHQEIMSMLGLGVFGDHWVGVTLIEYAIITLFEFAFVTIIAVILSKAYLGSYTTPAS